MRESIESILCQTYSNWELLIIDDFSSDQTAQIAKHYAELDSRIHFFQNQENLRLPKTLNKGFSLASGEYLTWTSDDNFYYPSAFSKMVLKLKEGADFVFASCDIIDEHGTVIEEIAVTEESPKRLIGTDTVGACFLYTRAVYEAVGDYDPEMILVEDYDYWLRVHKYFQSATISEKLYAYRQHSTSLTGTEGAAKISAACEQAILKHRPPLKTLDFLSKYYLYEGLYRCRIAMGDKKNIYRQPYRQYRLWYLLFILYPKRVQQYGILGSFRRLAFKLRKSA